LTTRSGYFLIKAQPICKSNLYIELASSFWMHQAESSSVY